MDSASEWMSIASAQRDPPTCLSSRAQALADAWKDGEQNGEPNERRDVHPLLPGAHPQPSLRQWLYADLGPGDVLFLPHSWWHYVDSEPHSVMTNLWVD